jgi:hypothetical protein
MPCWGYRLATTAKLIALGLLEPGRPAPVSGQQRAGREGECALLTRSDFNDFPRRTRNDPSADRQAGLAQGLHVERPDEPRYYV